MRTCSKKDEVVASISEEIDLAFSNAKSAKYFDVDDWESLNFSNISNSSIKIKDANDDSFHKSDTLPGPY